eukprot:COSAG01_NODE_62639_length_283_cov_1.413043_1_plen_33_part_01
MHQSILRPTIDSRNRNRLNSRPYALPNLTPSHL